MQVSPTTNAVSNFKTNLHSADGNHAHKMAYNLRATSLIGTKLDNELRRYGAHTSGSTERKQARLQRFMNAAEERDERRETLLVVIENNERKVYNLRRH